MLPLNACFNLYIYILIAYKSSIQYMILYRRNRYTSRGFVSLAGFIGHFNLSFCTKLSQGVNYTIVKRNVILINFVRRITKIVN